jgi:hypothetical protein
LPRLRRVLAGLALAVLLALPQGLAFLADYDQLPTEHDDQGRSDEPDRLATGVLGPIVENCVLSFDPGAVPGAGRACVPDAALPPPSGAPGVRAVAPGCTDDNGREQSGLCGLYTIGVHVGDTVLLQPRTVGAQGMSGDRAPGAYTPTKASSIRLLDVQSVLYAVNSAYTSGLGWTELNRKLADSGLVPFVRLAANDAAQPLIAPLAGFWAWYGVWQDRNGNGVIDHLGDTHGNAYPENEFRWVGKCGSVSSAACIREPGLFFPVWIWPGEHHQSCGVGIFCLVPADVPGKQPLCLASDAAGLPALTTLACPPLGDMDDEVTGGDPVLGAQTRSRADGAMTDATDQVDIKARLWRYSSPSGISTPPAAFYDQSLLVTTLVVGGPTLAGADPGLAQTFDLSRLQFVDVDKYASWNPTAESMLQGTVKPTAREGWLLVRDSYLPAQTWLDGVENARALDLSPDLAPLDDQLRDPGWSREPNTPQDLEPGAAFGAFAPSLELPASEQQHRGWLNSYAGYRSGWHAFADLKAKRVEFTYGSATVLGIPLGVRPGAILGDSIDVLTPGGVGRPPWDHARSLDPGVYAFHGFVGAWRDRPQGMLERVLDPVASAEGLEVGVREDRYALPADGWVGNVVNTTGGFRYRGYGAEGCTLEGETASRAYSVCHPYLDDNVVRADTGAAGGQNGGIDLSDPQDYASDEVLHASPPAQPYVVTLTPAGGTWEFPVFVVRDFYNLPLDNPVVESWLGRSGPITLRVLQDQDPSFPTTRDLLVLPDGNMLQDVTSELAGQVVVSAPSLGVALGEGVRDVDVYRGWRPP